MIDLQYAIITEVSLSVADAAIAVRRSAEAHKWGVLGAYDFTEILGSKGFGGHPAMKTVDICSPANADKMLGMERSVGVFLPCNIMIYAEGGKTFVATLRPSAVFAKTFPGASEAFHAQAKAIEAELEAIFGANA